MISIAGLTKVRAAVTVLEDVSLEAAEGTVTAVVGASGSGKTTLLRCLNGLETFDAGRLSIAGHLVGPGVQSPVMLDRLRRDVGMVFQSFHLFPHLSVLGNVMLAPRAVLRLDEEEARNRGLELLDQIGRAHV